MYRNVIFRLLLLLHLLLGASTAVWAQNIAVWNPERGTSETRFNLDLKQLDATAQALRAANFSVERLTSAQINEPELFSAQKFDALVLTGNTFPQTNVQALRDFTGAGGVLLSLQSSVPFLIAIETNPDGTWTMAPKTPVFAWQKPDVSQLFGLKYSYKPEVHNSGTLHEPEPLLKKYLPEAVSIRDQLPSSFIFPGSGAEMFPLLGSRRNNGDAVTPQIYIAQKGPRRAIVVGGNFATQGVAGWPNPAQVVTALARMASDLKSGRLQLDPAQIIVDLDKLEGPRTLEFYPATAKVAPLGTQPIVQWGHFNGSSLDLPRPTNQNSMVALPRSLEPGQSVRLDLGQARFPAGKPVFLRARGGYNATGAGLKLELRDASGTRVLWNELFSYIDSRSPGNFNASLAGFPTAWTRLIFLPVAGAPQALTVSNSGTKAIYFDALQLETWAQEAPERYIGMGSGSPTIPREVSRSWTNTRGNPRPQKIGLPGASNRWEEMDKTMAHVADANGRFQVVLEGTPDWAAISPERLELGKKAGRPHTVPPDTHKYARLVEDFVLRYKDKVDAYEIWNEPDIQQFWRGTNAEYIELYNALVPVIRRHDPSAKILTAGMAGFNDVWISHLVDAQVPQKADLFALHPYAGKSASWDKVYGLTQDALLSRGQNIEIYCNESGFVSRNFEWFQPPPNFTPDTQAQLLNVAMARLLATDLNKLNIFHAGGNGHPYGLFDEKGQPLPAYAVFADYLPLGQHGARRLDIALTGARGEALQGIYTAAASHSDGSATVVLNPAEVDALQPQANPSTEFGDITGWTTFFGKSKIVEGKAEVTPEEGKANAGFYTNVTVDIARLPLLELDVPRSQGGYDLLFKLPGGKQIPVITRGAAGTWRGDLRQLLPAGTRAFEISFRVFGPTEFDSLRFSSEAKAAPEAAIPVRLLVPLTGSGAYKAEGTSLGQPVPLTVNFARANGLQWAEIALPLSARTRVHFRPAK